jgi:hypothetical protein
MIDPKLSDDEEKQLLGEILSDKLQAILEYVEDVPVIKQKVTRLGEDMVEVKADIKVIKAVLTDHNRQLDNHETRITRLETA